MANNICSNLHSSASWSWPETSLGGWASYPLVAHGKSDKLSMGTSCCTSWISCFPCYFQTRMIYTAQGGESGFWNSCPKRQIQQYRHVGYSPWETKCRRVNPMSFFCHMDCSKVCIFHTHCLEIAHLTKWTPLLWYNCVPSWLISEQWVAEEFKLYLSLDALLSFYHIFCYPGIACAKININT